MLALAEAGGGEEGGGSRVDPILPIFPLGQRNRMDARAGGLHAVAVFLQLNLAIFRQRTICLNLRSSRKRTNKIS
jgi:hypothetical protein